MTTKVFPLFSILVFQSVVMLCKKVFSSVFKHVKSSVWWPRFHCCVEFFFQCLRNLGNIAKIFLHALSISKKHNMIAFLTLAGFCRRMGLIISCYMPWRHSMVPTGVSWLNKYQAIKAFHTDVELWQGCVCFFSFIVGMNWIDKCNQANEFATIGKWMISYLLSADDLILLLQNLAFSAH